MKKMLAALLAGLIGMGAAASIAAQSLDTPGESKEGAPSPESQALVRSYKVLGKVVKGSDDEELGRITQILLDPESGQAVYVVITSEGVPGVAREERLVPWQALQVNSETFDVRLAMTGSRFEQGSRWAVISSERQAEEINRFYGVAPRWQHEGAAAGQQQQERGDLKTNGSRMPEQGRPQPPRRQP